MILRKVCPRCRREFLAPGYALGLCWRCTADREDVTP
jgi:hypothetical protein